MCGEELYATDDENKKMALMRLAERCGMGKREDDVYWLKPHGQNGAESSQTMRRHTQNQSSTSYADNSHLLSGGGEAMNFSEAQSPPLSSNVHNEQKLANNINTVYYKTSQSPVCSPKAVVRYAANRNGNKGQRRNMPGTITSGI